MMDGETMDADEWIYEWRGVLVRAGFDRVEAAWKSLEAYGHNACKADLTACPWCEACRWLLRQGFIPAAADRH